jgi:hypothetical protein
MDIGYWWNGNNRENQNRWREIQLLHAKSINLLVTTRGQTATFIASINSK